MVHNDIRRATFTVYRRATAVRRFGGDAAMGVWSTRTGVCCAYRRHRWRDRAAHPGCRGEPGVLADNVGAFPGGISIPLVADSFSAIMLLTTAVVSLAAMWFADIVGETRARFFPALALMLLGGAWGALLTADLFNLFVFIEVMLMPSFGLIAMTGTWPGCPVRACSSS